jgi:tetratricopeptide (TPR) repeat protein
MLMHHLKFKAALDSFDKAILMKNQNEQFFVFSLYNAGLCSQKINDHKNALKYLKKAILVNPTSIEILNALGLSYYSLMSQTENIAEQKENATLAKSLYEQAIKINPHYYLTYHNYGTLKFDTKNYNEAVEMFNKSLMLN